MEFGQEHENDVLIHSITFTDEAVTIVFAEKRDTSRYVAMGKQITFDRSRLDEEVEEVLDSVRDLLDQAQILHRNPPKRIRRERGRSIEEFEEDEED